MPTLFQVRLGTTEAIARNGTGVEGSTMITIPFSSTYKTTSTTIVDSARNVEGYVVASVIRANIRKIELTWRVISCVDYSKIAKFLNQNFTFYAYYFDQDDNTWECRNCYTGDKVADALQQEQWELSTNIGGGVAPKNIQNYKLSLIEV